MEPKCAFKIRLRQATSRAAWTFYLATALLFASAAQAQFTCSEVHVRQEWLDSHVEFLTEDFDPKIQKDMRQVIWELRRLMPSLDSSYFAIDERDAAADNYRYELHYPAPSPQELKAGIRSAYFAGFAHEAGHLFFEGSMMRFKFWSQAREKLDPRERGPLSTGDDWKLSAMMSSYHELFADMAAVVWSKNPKAISEVLDGDPARDFEQPNFRQWRKRRSFSEEHLYFYPVRVAFWRAIQNRLNEPAFRQNILPIAFQILAQDAKAHFGEYSKDPKVIESQNRRLAAALAKALGSPNSSPN